MAQMYSLRNAAGLLGVKTRTAREWVKTGKMAAVKYEGSNRWYVSAEEIDRLRGGNNDNKD